jgi:hypothetical protein
VVKVPRQKHFNPQLYALKALGIATAIVGVTAVCVVGVGAWYMDVNDVSPPISLSFSLAFVNSVVSLFSQGGCYKARESSTSRRYLRGRDSGACFLDACSVTRTIIRMTLNT